MYLSIKVLSVLDGFMLYVIPYTSNDVFLASLLGMVLLRVYFFGFFGVEHRGCSLIERYPR